MKILDPRSIGSKLRGVVLAGILLAIVVSITAITLYDRARFEQSLFQQVSTLAEVTGQRSTAALTFNDKRTLHANLASMFNLESLRLACIYDETLQLKAHHYLENYTSEDCPTPDFKHLEELIYIDRELALMSPIQLKGRTVGYIFVLASLEELTQRTLTFGITAILIGVISSFAALVLTNRWQHQIIDPIVQLSQIAEEVRTDHNFSLRGHATTEDEVGRLVESFNNMLSTVQYSQVQTRNLVEELRDSSLYLEDLAEQSQKRHDTIKQIMLGASHDLQQPLQAMSLFLTALSPTASEEQEPIIRKLNLAMDNMSNMFREVLDISRIEEVRAIIDKDDIDMQQFLKPIVSELDALAADRALTIRVRVATPTLHSNAAMLERVVRNLVGNAIRYTRSGGVLISVRERHNAYWLEIWDSGQGIPESEQEKIFQRFAQVQGSSDEGGFGLGLAIVKQLCELLGHSVEVTSIPGRGSRFRVTIAKHEHATATQELVPSSYAPQASDQSISLQQQVDFLSHLEVMLVDDDDGIRAAVKELLENWGMQVVDADSLFNIKLHVTMDPDYCPELIISDFQLGDSDTGLHAIQMIREEIGEDIPAIIITANRDPKILMDIRNQGFQILSKPVKPAKLRALINYVLSPAAES